MHALLIDTSIERGFVALIKDDMVLVEKQLPVGYNNSKDIIVNISSIFDDCGIKGDDLDFIAVGAGPGSYTGIRVGVIVAKTLAFSFKKPLVGISTLKGFKPDVDGKFAVLIDAKISGLYAIKGEVHNGEISYNDEHVIKSWDAIGDYTKDVESILTPNAKNIHNIMKKKNPTLNCTWKECYPDALHFYKEARNHYDNHQYTLDGSLDIYYLRRTQAEIELEAKQKGR